MSLHDLKKQILWLMPGLFVKRWLGLVAIGFVMLILGVSLSFGLQPVTTFISLLKVLAYANLPKQKRVALQLDMKNKEATQPVIKALNQFKKDHPQAWEDSMIILNGDIPIGKSHRFNLFNFRTWPILFQSKLDLEDMQALSKAFPDTVISLGIASYIKNLDNSLLEAIDTTFKQFSGQGKLICLPASLKISKEAVAQFTQNNMLMKFWSSQSHQYTKPSDGDALRKTIHVPADTPFWVEF